MFEQWGFLLTEIWVLLILAALIGLIAGWLIFGGQQNAPAGSGKANKLRSEIDHYRVAAAQQQARISDLEGQLASKSQSATVTPLPTTIPPVSDIVVEPLPDVPTEVDPTEIGKKPIMLDEPNGGQADDLKKIKGVGPRLEQMCNMMGIWHYDQIAKWTDVEIAWVDENLQGFQGRVTRDEWVSQANVLATGGQTEFSKKFDDKADKDT